MEFSVRAKTIKQNHPHEEVGLEKIGDFWYAIGNLRLVIQKKTKNREFKRYFIETEADMYNNHEIEYDTRAIHFEDMIDSEGTEIFASLSEDGKGGDIVDMGYNFIRTTMKVDVSLFQYSFKKAKVTGMQG